MPNFVEPKAFLIAETKLLHDGLKDSLTELGVPNWTTDAASDAEHLIEFSGKMCYASLDTKLNKNLTRIGTRNNHDYIQEQIIATAHGSVLEHGTLTFFIANLSRICSHELVRHRAGNSFSQISGRYVRTDRIDFWAPSVIENDKWAKEFFLNAFSTMEGWTKELGEHYKIDGLTGKDGFKLKKILTSAFRRIIGNGQSNHIVITTNHRSLRHMIELRTDIGAEEEIRVIFNQIFNLVKDHYPSLYADANVISDEDGSGLFSVKFVGKKV